jgi:hypothetical protein
MEERALKSNNTLEPPFNVPQISSNPLLPKDNSNRAVFLNHQAAAWYQALASIILGPLLREK